MFHKLKFLLIMVFSFLFFIYILPLKEITSYLRYELLPQNNYSVNLSLINSGVKAVSADSSNKLILKAEVRDALGMPASNIRVNFSVPEKAGEIRPLHAQTNRDGETLVTYVPPNYSQDLFKEDSYNITLAASIQHKGTASSLKLLLVRNPIVYVHGYLEDAMIFSNLKSYLESKKFSGSAMDYNTENGVVAAAKDLDAFLMQQKDIFLSKGVQVKKFDIIAHSMGGLVTRYYTCGKDYINANNVRKIIFISVPHRGSPWAPMGTNYFKDQGIKDLIPDNLLLTEMLPSMINKGLNSTIQTGSIMGQYDEVVSFESASLDDWNIKTEVFNIGDNSFTMDNLLNGSIMGASNHKAILSNKKVFEKIENMLTTDLPYPIIRK